MDMLKRIKNYLTKHLFCTVVADDVMTIAGNGKLIFLKKEQIADSEWKMLAEEVKYFENTKLYKILYNTVAEQARLKMFEDSKTTDDMIFGKAMLFTADVQKNIMKYLKQYKPR